MDGPEFWDIIESTPGIVVAVLDSGLNSTHPDLKGIKWNNPGEIAGDGIDNDFSGKIDDMNGWDFVNNDNNPTDDHGHGSNVTGIIAANRNNGVGIAGMLSGVRILVCKILNSSNSGLTSNLVAATTYARQRGVPVMNLSLQNYPYSSALNTEFNACKAAGIVLVICAGSFVDYYRGDRFQHDGPVAWWHTAFWCTPRFLTNQGDPSAMTLIINWCDG